MTACVGVVCRGSIAVAADSCLLDSSTGAEWLTGAKIRQVGTLIAAGAGAANLIGSFLDSLTAKDQGRTPQDLARRLGDLAEDTEDEDGCTDFVLAVGGHMWVIDSTGSCVRPSQRYVAIGGGAKAALGALYTLTNPLAMEGDEDSACIWARTAVEAAASCCQGVRLPAIVMSARRGT